MRRGAFITLEGGEGVGKSSSLAAVESFLTDRGFDVRTTREPGGTALGEAVRSWLLDGEHENLSAEAEALLKKIVSEYSALSPPTVNKANSYLDKHFR